jgi:hypothetical protein
MIEIVNDKKILKIMKATIDSDESYNVVSFKSWHVLSPLFRNITYNLSNDSPAHYIMFYLQFYIYDDFISAFGLTKSSFTVNDGTRFKHYALKYEYDDNVYYFSLSYNKDYGINLYFYPIFNNAKVMSYADTESFREYSPLIYNFSSVFYEKILTHLLNERTLDDFKSYLAIKEKSIIEDRSSNQLIENYYASRDFSLIMPPI